MKSLALIELENHNEVLRAYLITLLQTEYHVICFTTAFNRAQLYDINDSRITFVIKSEDQSTDLYFREHDNHLASCKLAIAITLRLSDSFFQTYKWPCKSILVVHNYHKYFNPLSHISWAPKDIVRLIRDKIRGTSKPIHKSINRFDGIVMPSDICYQYAVERGNHKISLLGSLDFCVHEENVKIYNRDVVQIAIPGTISEKSRHYKLIIQALNLLSLKEGTKIKIHFLGKPKGRIGTQIVKVLQSIKHHQLDLVFYNDFIPQRQYDQIIRDLDFLVIPIKRNMKAGGILEKSGYSCVSGNIGDMVKYSIPAILPDYYPLDPRLEIMVGRYDKPRDLSELMKTWIEEKEFNRIKTKIRDKMTPFGPEARSQKFLEIIDKKTSKA